MFPTSTEFLCNCAESVSGIFYALSGILKYLQFTSNCSQLLDLQLGASTRDVGLMDHADNTNHGNKLIVSREQQRYLFTSALRSIKSAASNTSAGTWEYHSPATRAKMYETRGTLRNVPSNRDPSWKNLCNSRNIAKRSFKQSPCGKKYGTCGTLFHQHASSVCGGKKMYMKNLVSNEAETHLGSP